MLDLIVVMTVTNPAEIDAVARALATMRPICLSEPGCVSWEAYQFQEDAARFVLVERWESRDAWDAHGELSAIQDVYLPEILPRVTREVHPSRRMGI